MKAVVKYGLALALIVGISGGQAGQDLGERTRPLHLRTVAASSANRGPCDSERWLRITPTEANERLIDGLIRCATARFSVPGGYAKAECIADLESSDWAWARGGPNLGLFQVSSWIARAHSFLKARWFNDAQWERITTKETGAFLARANALTAAVWAHRAWSWSAWSTEDRCGP